MSDRPQMFTCGPHSCAQELRGRLAASHFPPYASSQVVLLRPYITLTRVQPLKRPDQTLSEDDDIFAIPPSQVREHLFTDHCRTSGTSSRSVSGFDLNQELKEDFFFLPLSNCPTALIEGSTPALGICYRYSHDPSWESPRTRLPLAPPGGNGGRKNAEGGSELPSGTLRDGEAERWTDDNGREAGA